MRWYVVEGYLNRFNPATFKMFLTYVLNVKGEKYIPNKIFLKTTVTYQQLECRKFDIISARRRKSVVISGILLLNSVHSFPHLPYQWLSASMNSTEHVCDGGFVSPE